MAPLQLFGINPLAELVLIFGFLVLTIGIGTYLGVLMALQSFFGESTWEDVSTPDTN